MGFLRVCLAIAVLAFHATGGYPSFFIPMHGGTAVFCFFVVSGFYMEMVLAEKYTREKLGNKFFLQFYASRYLRLMPIYTVVGLITLVLAMTTNLIKIPQVFAAEGGGVLHLVRQAVALLANLTMLFSNIPSVKDLIVSPAWSIGVEISFYCLAPFILRWRLAYLVGLALIGFVLQFISLGQHAPILFGMQFFLTGALVYRYRMFIFNGRLGFDVLKNKFVLYGLILAIVSFSMPVDIAVGHATAHSHNYLDRLIYPFVIAFLLPFLHEATKRNRFDLFIAQLSYPFYLVHQPLLDITRFMNIPQRFGVVLVTCRAISALLNVAETRWVDPWRARFAQRKAPAAA